MPFKGVCSWIAFSISTRQRGKRRARKRIARHRCRRQRVRRMQHTRYAMKTPACIFNLHTKVQRKVWFTWSSNTHHHQNIAAAEQQSQSVIIPSFTPKQEHGRAAKTQRYLKISAAELQIQKDMCLHARLSYQGCPGCWLASIYVRRKRVANLIEIHNSCLRLENAALQRNRMLLQQLNGIVCNSSDASGQRLWLLPPIIAQRAPVISITKNSPSQPA